MLLLLVVFLIFPPRSSRIESNYSSHIHSSHTTTFSSQIRKRDWDGLGEKERVFLRGVFPRFSTLTKLVGFFFWMGFSAFGARFSAPGWFGWMLLNWLNSQQNYVVFLFCFRCVYAAKLCCVLFCWVGTVFFYKHEKSTSTTSTCSWSSRNFNERDEFSS